jgi:hypothetical protein
VVFSVYDDLTTDCAQLADKRKRFMSAPLDTLDTLISDFRQALAADDPDALIGINGQVRHCVEEATAEMRAGRVAEEALRDKLVMLQKLTAQATRGAEEARAAAEAGLKDVSRNRSAARQYANIGGRGPG